MRNLSSIRFAALSGLGADAPIRCVVRRALAAGMTVAAGMLAHPVAADEVADFYKSRTVTIIVGHEVGTGFDIYARALARYLSLHIPGQPNIIVQNMVGASGVTAANWLYNLAPKDGTVMGTFVHTVPFEPLFGNSAAKFDPTKFSWIGNVEQSVGVCGVSTASGISKFDDLLVKETVFGATGATGPLGKFALAIKNELGAKIKLVSGYKGSASVKIAIQRGEVHGICGLPMSTIRSSWREEYESGAFKPIIQLSGMRSDQLNGIPHVDDYAKSSGDRQLFNLIFGAQVLGRVFAAPPNMPKERTRALRAAFMAVMKDTQFVAEAAKAQIDISPMAGEEVEAFITRLSAVPPSVVARSTQAFRVD